MNSPTSATSTELSFLLEGTIATIQPVFYQDSPLGVLVLVKSQHPDANTVMFDDALIINLISSQIGVAIQQARQWKQLQKANIQLSKLDELKSNLIDTVSHELRTPLTNIKGYTSRLIRYEDSLDSDTKIKSLKVIKQQADRLGRLVEDLLVIPEIEQKEGIRVFPDRVNLYELINRCVSFIGEKANREIVISDTSIDLDVLVDPDRMEQVVLNLLDNAIKYSYEGTAIEVAVHQCSEEQAQISIFNQCAPIAHEELSTLFSKFKRLDERLTRTTRGTGLGLFITKGLIEAMSGTIWLEGHDGFRVNVNIPLYEAHRHIEQDSESTVTTG
jgi:two-component system phosphate regulon sensor histidine kinase PhoR